MLRFELPTDRVEYFQLALVDSGLVARWGTQSGPFTVAVWDNPGTPGWQRSSRPLDLSPDGQWISVFDADAGNVTITRVGAQAPTATVKRSRAKSVWTTVAPDGSAVAWKDEAFMVVRAVPGGEPIARVKSGWGFDLRFSPDGRWVTELGERTFRVFDRADGYRVFARIPTPRHALAHVSGGLTAVVTAQDGDTVSVWDMARKSATATLDVGEWVSALAISPDGKLVLTGNANDEVTLWDASGTKLKQFAWGLEVPVAAAIARDGTRAAIGGTDGQIVVWDLDD